MLLARSDQPSIADRARYFLVVRMREGHHKTLEETSAKTFRRRVVPTSPAPRLVAAARIFKGMGWLPASLIAPEKLPKEAKLPLRYVLPYYGVGKLGWWLYGRSPISPGLAWDPSSDWNRAFPDGEAGWRKPTDDDCFTQLRLQGPNPFMLKTAKPDPARGDASDAVLFDLDFSRLFAGVFEPTTARFRLDGDKLIPAWITVGEQIHRPGEPGWTDAKRVVNALDARYSAFIRHLLNTHLMVGQAFALAAYTLPIWHPLRPFMDFFTYGTMQVNHYAYEALLMPNSYFLRSNFVSASDARRIIENAMNEFDFDEWSVPTDIAKRGIGAIPKHPYVHDAELVWPQIVSVVDRHLVDLDITTDADVLNDPHLAAWYGTIREVLPGTESLLRLTELSQLKNLMTAMIYNNVIHEVCGNLSPILDSQEEADKFGINFEHLRGLADPKETPQQPKAADVFLMDQASYVSRFNVKGNNLLTICADRYIDDPRLADAVKTLQKELKELDKKLRTVNAEREISFTAMQPKAWEASISF